jgi:hypothetical protein
MSIRWALLARANRRSIKASTVPGGRNTKPAWAGPRLMHQSMPRPSAPGSGQSLLNRAGNAARAEVPATGSAMGFGDGASRLPSFLLPCTHCGHRIVITAVTRLPLLDAVGSDDLDDVTHLRGVRRDTDSHGAPFLRRYPRGCQSGLIFMLRAAVLGPRSSSSRS